MAGVDGNHPRCPVLEQTIRETARGSSHVKTDFTRDLNVPMLKRFLELEATTADVLQIFAQQTNIRIRVHTGAGFFYFLPADKNLACQDQRLRPLARTCQSAFQQ